jgi:hypothetical protein
MFGRININPTIGLENSVHYVLKAGQRVDRTFLHCRVCHYTAPVRGAKAPDQCPNVTGYKDKQANHHPRCPHPRRWDEWPENFDPDTTNCKECLVLWVLEQKEQEEMA